MNLPQPSQTFERDSALLKILEAERQTRLSQNRLASYLPYSKQREFHEAGARYRERCFLAGNQLGKTVAGSSEMAMHLTGRYPDWWRGRRWDRPTIWWAAGVTGESTRDNPQRLLMGRVGEFGTGTIPKACIVDHSRASHGVSDLLDTISIRHVSGGLSTVALKFYEKGREKWQGETLDGVWFDEEPPSDIYSEGLTRTNATGGMVFLTCTPLLGMTEVVRRFLEDNSPDRHLTQMTIDDAEHYTPEQRTMIIRGYPAHEREARAKGIPMLGSGRIYPIAEEKIVCDPIKIPKHWARLGALDFGFDHPFAAGELAHDKDSDVVYLTRTYRAREEIPALHCAALRQWGEWLSWAWPHDGLNREKSSGQPLAEEYKKNGLNMLPDKAQFEDGSVSVEAGILELLERMQTGRFKVFRQCEDWLQEFRLYHRDEGKIVKERDDLMDMTRYGIMMLRFAKTEPVKSKPVTKPKFVV
jgi:phage terminase large subunit-like protein